MIAKKSDSAHQLRQRNAQRFRNLFQIHKGYVSFTSLNAANVGSIELARIGKSFLGQTKPLAAPPQIVAETDSDVFHLELGVIFGRRR